MKRAATRKRQGALAKLLDRLAADRGKLDTPEDQAEIARYARLLSDIAEEPGSRRSGSQTMVSAGWRPWKG